MKGYWHGCHGVNWDFNPEICMNSMLDTGFKHPKTIRGLSLLNRSWRGWFVWIELGADGVTMTFILEIRLI